MQQLLLLECIVDIPIIHKDHHQHQHQLHHSLGITCHLHEKIVFVFEVCHMKRKLSKFLTFSLNMRKTLSSKECTWFTMLRYLFLSVSFFPCFSASSFSLPRCQGAKSSLRLILKQVKRPRPKRRRRRRRRRGTRTSTRKEHQEKKKQRRQASGGRRVTLNMAGAINYSFIASSRRQGCKLMMGPLLILSFSLILMLPLLY